MRVEVIGGGPAGLYFGILMKRLEPGVEITIRERNRPDDTFGFGVVFSDETLGFLDDADPESAAEIRARFRSWREIRTQVRGTWTVSTGHGFAAIARTELLAVLQRRAAELGCELRFEAEVGDPEALAAGADLLIGCDGVASTVRERWAASFAPTVEHGRCRFAWLGSTQPLDAFTFLFVEGEHGLFQVHAYPYAEGRSTFIVETHEEAWRAAGLDGADEAATVDYCERLCAPWLDGHRLLANRSIWRRFPTVTCGSWRHRNAVLLGDAANTAHFSIGSGTKLAMEDSIALVETFRAHGTGDVPHALEVYENGRRLDVAKLQRAAKTSRSWFEQSRRYRGQHPVAFTFNLMSRSKRITYDNLRERDPAFAACVDRWYREAHGPRAAAGADVEKDFQRRVGSATVERAAAPSPELFTKGLSTASGSSAMPNAGHTAPPPMFTPFTVRGLTLRNRIVVSPMCMYSAKDGTPNDWHLVHLGARAVGGAALVVAEMTDVSAEGRITHGCAGMYERAHVAAWKRIVDFAHVHARTPIGLQLAHAGRKGSMRHDWSMRDEPLVSGEGAWPTLAPSAMPYKAGWPAPRAMTRADMERVRDEFARAATWADEAGFDWLELHGAHGYLLSSYLSPLANFRADDYGGSLENRMRYPLEVFAAMRDAWPAAKPMSVRVSATDWFEETGAGTTADETVAFARELKRLGCDLIDVSTAGNVPESEPEFGRMYQVPFAEKVRYEAGLPVMAVGAIQGADHANTVLAAERADLVVMARPHLYDPYLTLHAAARYGVEVEWPGQYELGKPRIER
jgi:anthraniloyl-CoA monooxygenase